MKTPTRQAQLTAYSLDSFLLTFFWAYLLVDKVDLDGKCDTGSARSCFSGERQAQGKKASRFHPPLNDHLPICFWGLKSLATLLQMEFEKVGY
jgi:hypothetical protein